MKVKSEAFVLVFNFACEWVKKQMKPFTSEDLRTAYIATEKPLPDDLRVFGNVFTALGHKEAIFKTDTFITSKMKNAHGRPVRQWISKEYKLKQKGNRLAPYKDQTQLFDV